MSIRVWFPVFFSCAIMVCMAVLIIFFSNYLSRQIYENAKTDMERQAESLAGGVEREIYNMIDTVNEIYYQNIRGKNYLADDFSSELTALYHYNQGKVSQMCLYDNEGRLIWGSSKKVKQHADQEQWFREAQKKIETIYFGSESISSDEDELVQTIPVSKYVELNREGVRRRGVLVLYFPMQQLNSVLDTYGSTAIEYCYLADQSKNFLYHPYRKKIQSGICSEWSLDKIKKQDSYYTAEEKDSDWLIGSRTIGYTGWRLVIVNSLANMRIENYASYRLVWLIFCIVGFVMVFADIILLKQITNPIARLSEAMELFGSGKLDARVRETGIGEIHSLESGFNTMAENTKMLMEQKVAQEKEKRYMEQKLFQAQISPHFLYNTLDSIIWMIQGKQYEGAGEMISLLAKFFRVALSRGEDIITLRQELEHAISYLSIQNIRFQDKFDFEVEIDESLMEYTCPKIIIQPILENAIYHGVENLYGDGEIILSIREKNGEICIEVTDNGEGMTQEQIQDILHHKTDAVPSEKGSGVGIYNVDSRIRLLYGDAYGITIYSEIDEGTTVQISIPKVGGRSDE